jgi:hypothetical protein
MIGGMEGIRGCAAGVAGRAKIAQARYEETATQPDAGTLVAWQTVFRRHRLGQRPMGFLAQPSEGEQNDR